MTLIVKSDVALTVGGASAKQMLRKAAYVGGYRRQWTGLSSDIPGTAHAWCGEAQSQWSFPRQGNPANGDAIRDVFAGDSDGAGYGDGDIFLPNASQSIAYEDGGFRFSSFLSPYAGAGVRAPAALSAAMYTHPTDSAKNDQWLVWAWVKLPAEADWPQQAGTTPPIINMAASAESEPSAFSIRMGYSSGSGRLLWFSRRIGNGPNYETQLTFAAGAIPYGKTVLIGAWRKGPAAADIGFFLRGEDGEQIRTAASNAANATDYSGKRIIWGVAGPGIGTLSHAGGSSANDLRHHVIKAWGAEPLAITGRNPLDLMRAEWAARNAFGLSA